jgi:ankyrin repeat protein
LLLDGGADKNALAPNSYTPLMLAVRNGHGDAAKALLLADANVSHRGPSGETALAIARKRDDQALTELLKRAGATD